MQEFIFYYLPKCPTCKGLLEKINENGLDNTLFIQNVLLLQELPPWLVGVPTMIQTTTGLMYKGTDCITLLNAIVQNIVTQKEVGAYMKATNQMTVKKEEEQKQEVEEKTKPKGMKALFESDDFPDDVTKPFNEKEEMKKNNSITENMLADLMAKRGTVSKINEL